jgi:hypothetical protein
MTIAPQNLVEVVIVVEKNLREDISPNFKKIDGRGCSLLNERPVGGD